MVVYIWVLIGVYSKVASFFPMWICILGYIDTGV